MTHSLLHLGLPFALFVGGCATRSTTPRPPVGSPLSVLHPSGVASRVTRALDEEPPLPGEDASGWVGLDPNADGHTGGIVAGNPHAQHSHQPPVASAPSGPSEGPPAAPQVDGRVHDAGAHGAH